MWSVPWRKWLILSPQVLLVLRVCYSRFVPNPIQFVLIVELLCFALDLKTNTAIWHYVWVPVFPQMYLYKYVLWTSLNGDFLSIEDLFLSLALFKPKWIHFKVCYLNPKKIIVKNGTMCIKIPWALSTLNLGFNVSVWYSTFSALQ